MNCPEIFSGFIESLTTGSFERVRSFVENNPEIVSSSDGHETTALHYVCGHWYSPSLSPLGRGDNKGLSKSLFDSTENNFDFNIAKLLLDNGANVNKDGFLSRKAIHYAAAANPNADVLKLLIDRGSEINPKEENRVSPLDLAVRNTLAHVNVLLENGADINIGLEDNYNPLCSALYSNSDIEIIAYLIEHGADIHLKGERPLHFAVRHSNTNVVKLLVERGADVFYTDSEGHTLLHYASFCSTLDLNTLKLLIDFGVNVNAKSNYGRTALDGARLSKTKDVLIGLGAKRGFFC